MSASGEDTWTTFLLLDPSIATEHSPVVGVSHEIDEHSTGAEDYLSTVRVQ